MAAIVGYPLVFGFLASLRRVDLIRGAGAFVGLANYGEVLADPVARLALIHTVVFVILSVGLQFLVGLGLAMLLNSDVLGVRGFRALLVFPFAIAPTVTALQWRWLYADQYGLINLVLRRLGLAEPLWLAQPTLAFVSVIVADTWRNAPFIMLVLLAGLHDISGELIEAALADGASGWQLFWWILLPLLRPVIAVAVLIRGIDAFRIFDLVYVLTAGGPALATEMVSTYGYRIAFSNLDLGAASALAFIAAALVAVLSRTFIRILAVAPQ
jgi:multiple sugar transport system permease protein